MDVQAAAGEPSAEDDENVDLEAVLGGNIRKAPATVTADEPEPVAAETGA